MRKGGWRSAANDTKPLVVLLGWGGTRGASVLSKAPPATAADYTDASSGGPPVSGRQRCGFATCPRTGARVEELRVYVRGELPTTRRGRPLPVRPPRTRTTGGPRRLTQPDQSQ